MKSARERLTAANSVGLLGAIIALFCLLGIPSDQYWNLRIPLYLIVTIWSLVSPQITLYLLPAAVAWGSVDPIGGLTSADVLVGLLCASWLMSYTLRPLSRFSSPSGHAGRAKPDLSPGRDPILSRPLCPSRTKVNNENIPWYLVASMLLLLGAMIVSTIVSFSLKDSFKEIVKWSEVLVVIMLGIKYLRTRRQIWIVVVMICLAALSQAFLGYAQIFFNLGPASFMRDASLRVYGTFAQPNPYAGYINMALALAIALMLLGGNWATRILSGCTVIILAGVEYSSQSKGGWMALAAAVIFILALGFPCLRKWLWAAFILILCIIALYLAGKIHSHFIEPILTKIGVINISFTTPSTDNYANSERVAHWVAGINMFWDHPLLGVGMGNYQYSYPTYHPGIFVVPLGHAHDYYINIAAEAGLPGLTAFLLFLGSLFLLGARCYGKINKRCQEFKTMLSRQPSGGLLKMVEIDNKRRELVLLKNDRALAIGLLAALLSVCVHNLVDNLYVHAMTSLFALLFVLLVRLGE